MVDAPTLKDLAIVAGTLIGGLAGGFGLNNLTIKFGRSGKNGHTPVTRDELKVNCNEQHKELVTTLALVSQRMDEGTRKFDNLQEAIEEQGRQFHAAQVQVAGELGKLSGIVEGLQAAGLKPHRS